MLCLLFAEGRMQFFHSKFSCLMPSGKDTEVSTPEPQDKGAASIIRLGDSIRL